MIQATELRIGNFINTEISNGKETLHITNGGITGIFNDSIYLNTIKFEYRHLRPIPLTEEWLIKLGFTKSTGWDDMVFWRIGDGFNAFTLEETLQGYVNSNGNVIKTVHLLQNAFFFDRLDGQELTIKP